MHIVVGRGHAVPLFGVSTIGGSTVYIHSIYDQHKSHNITGDVTGSVGPPTQYQKHL